MGEGSAEGELRVGDDGFWQHWGDALRDRDPAAGPLRMEVIAGDDFAERDWLAELDRDVLAAVVDGGLVAGRVIVPPGALERPAEDLVALALGLGFEVRVLAGATPLTMYDGVAAVLPEPDASGAVAHRLVRQPAVLRALRALFDLHWASAMTWEEHRKGAAGVLELLARGRIDAQIAAELGVSPRTVSRRVAEAMAASGARSRFELGMRYGLSRQGPASG